jgi:Domain of unknown function (DUF4249)
MKYFKYLFLLGLVACQKNVDPELPPFEELLVVDASIFENEVAIVKLSKSFDYFGSFDSTTVLNKVIKFNEAKVTISDGEKTEELVFAPIVFGNRIVDIGYTSNPFSANGIRGKAGRTYTLKIEYNNKTYEAVSTILPKASLDSAWFDFKKVGEKNEQLGYMKVKFFEQNPAGDCYRSFAKRITKDSAFITFFNSVFDDKFFNGKSFELNYTRPIPQNSNREEDNDYRRRHFDLNDTVVLKFCKIGRVEYEFYNSVTDNISANGNPFSTAYNIKSNISNNGIGVFCAYGCRLDTIVLKNGKKFNYK